MKLTEIPTARPQTHTNAVGKFTLLVQGLGKSQINPSDSAVELST